MFLFCPLLIFLFKLDFYKKMFQTSCEKFKQFDTDQVRHFVGSDLDPNYFLKSYQQTTQAGELLEPRNMIAFVLKMTWCNIVR